MKRKRILRNVYRFHTVVIYEQIEMALERMLSIRYITLNTVYNKLPTNQQQYFDYCWYER